MLAQSSWPSRVLSWMPKINARMMDAVECVLSVLLAIAFAHVLDARNVYWAAFSGFMVMRGRLSESVLRGVLRILGTCLGAGLALLVVPRLGESIALTSAALVLVGLPSLYAALTAKRAYAWLFFGLTFLMILLDKLEHPEINVHDFVRHRILEILAGTLACVLVSMVSTLSLRRFWPATRARPWVKTGWNRNAFRHAAQGAAALALLPPLSWLVHIPQLAQAAVTILVVMLVPVSGIGPSGLRPVTRRIVLRVAGCVSGAAFSALLLFAAHQSVAIVLLGTACGVAFGKLIETSNGKIAYAGTQFVLATLVVLVPDSYADIQLDPGLARLTGIFIGMAILEPVLVAWHLLHWLDRSHTTQA